MPSHTGHSPCAPPEVTVLLPSELLLGPVLQMPEGVVPGTSSDHRESSRALCKAAPRCTSQSADLSDTPGTCLDGPSGR